MMGKVQVFESDECLQNSIPNVGSIPPVYTKELQPHCIVEWVLGINRDVIKDSGPDVRPRITTNTVKD